MNVLSLFDGMSCGRIALDRAGFDVDQYYASELDKYAIQVTQANWSDTIQLGDVTKWREWDIDWSSIDLLIGGSPCQGFSFAGKQLAFDDPRSKLFFVYVDILNHIRSLNPEVKFMLENVKMKKEYLAIINEQLGVQPVFINSALVSAQNRQRYYWANWDFGQPDDRGIVLADIIEDGEVDRDKSYCIDANYHKGGNPGQYFNKSRRQLVFNAGRDPLHEWKDASDKNPEIKGDYLQLDPNNKKQYSQCNRINLPHTKHKALSGTSGGNKHGVADANTLMYRKLTPVECERLQTIDDNFTAHVSNTQRYKCLGNAWTVDVIAHIFSHIETRMVLVEKQLDLFEGAA